ncbi:CCHC-type domain-containing protein [Nephila pilipes]|uniref:CCHC-type domain-containing protein n=1 Tax=Nephila pilipes TaxID=299642 RepID=A0A8X6ML85_NEPPI|nr:CCHC-type domain-containing protein [Nephila pilipes]
MGKTRSQATMADSSNAELLAHLDEMKKSMEAEQEEMMIGQEEMKIGQEEMKKRMEKCQNEMRVHVESQVEGIKEHVNTCTGKIKVDVQSVKRGINEVKSEVQEKISVLGKRLCDLEERPINSLPSSEVIYSKPTVKPLTFDGLKSWSVFKTQFDVVRSSNGWSDRVKANQLAASLRGTELKTRRQKPGESLQVLAADVERLMSLAYAESSLDIPEYLVAHYFVDAIKDEDTQYSTSLMDAKGLISALAYGMKCEAARTVSKISKHLRSLEVEDDSKKKEDEFESLFNRVEKLLNNCITEKRNETRRNPNVTCWQCNRKWH